MEAFIGLVVLGVLLAIFILPILAYSIAKAARKDVESLQSELYELRRTLTQIKQAQPEKPEAPQTVHTLLIRQKDRETPPPVEEEQPIEAYTSFHIEPPVQAQTPIQPEPPSEITVPEAPAVEQAEPEESPEEEPVPIAFSWRPQQANTVTEQANERRSRTREEWELLIGRNITNRFSAVVFMLIAAWFLKYAFDRHWITPWTQVSIGFICGSGIIMLGNVFIRKEARIFAQGLLGTGISILYLSVYAAFQMYHLVPQSLALLMMSLVTFTAVSVSVKCDALVVSLLGLLGGFLTPLLLDSGTSGGSGSWFGLFAYIALLDIGLLTVAVKRDEWAVIEPLALTGTALTYIFWHKHYYKPADIWLVTGFLTVFWLIFYFMDVYRITRRIGAFSGMRQMIAVVNSFLYYLAMYTIVSADKHLSPWMGLITLGIGAVYLAPVIVVLKRRIDDPVAIPRYLLTAISLMVIATSIQFNGYTRIDFWFVEALALVWCGLHWRLEVVWQSGLALFVIGAIAFASQPGAFSWTNHKTFHPVENLRFLAYCIFILTLGCSGIFFSRYREEGTEGVGDALHYCWCLVLIALATVEINDFFTRFTVLHPDVNVLAMANVKLRLLSISAAWMVLSLPLVWYGLRSRVEPLLYSGLVALAAGAAFLGGSAVEYQPAKDFAIFLNPRALSIVLAGLIIFSTRFMLKRRQSRYPWIPQMLEIMEAGISLLFLELLTVETVGYFEKLEALGYPTRFGLKLDLSEGLTLAGIWMLGSLGLTWLGRRKSLRTLWGIGLGTAVLGICTGALMGIQFEPSAGYKFLFNYRTGILVLSALTLLVHTRWLRRYNRQQSWSEWVLRASNIAFVLLGFELITVETVDLFHTLNLQIIDVEMARDLTLAMLWTVYSLPLAIYGLKKRSTDMIGLGSIVLALSVVTLLFRGCGYEPVRSFILLLNYQAVAFAVVVSALLLIHHMLSRNVRNLDFASSALSVIRVVICVLIFQFATNEAWMYFERLRTLQPEKMHVLGNLRQMSLSVVWVVYAICVMIYGIWRKSFSMRYIALGVLAITILKVFLSDLSFLDQPYRMLSFIPLGLILLATSYLYHRYHTFIFGDMAEEDT